MTTSTNNAPDPSHTITLGHHVLEVQRDEYAKKHYGKDLWMILYFMDEDGHQQSWIDHATPKDVIAALRSLKELGYMSNEIPHSLFG